MTAKHTPAISRQVIYLGSHDGYRTFKVPANSRTVPPYPHARLIAAAPDLLQAVEMLLQDMTTPDEQWVAGSSVEYARAALKRAKGEA